MSRRSMHSLTLTLLIVSTTLSGELTTGALTGNVSHDGSPLPGVTITISSTTMQGTRVAYSYVNGDYNFSAIPPGNYSVTFEMDGMVSQTKTVIVGLARTERVNAEMIVRSVVESLDVTAAAPSVLETTEVQANFDAELVDRLPIGRSVQKIVTIAPGVTMSPVTVYGAPIPILVGAQGYENLYLVNGAVTNENLFGQTEELFIEDAIQETTLLAASISAEYGWFTGGVVSAITKSGGNELSGSIRDSLTNPAWTAPSRLNETKHESSLEETYEATLGGRFVRDRLWFFLAGRYAETSASQYYTGTSVAHDPSVRTDERIEAKLTGQLTSRHSLVGSWLDFDTTQTNDCVGGTCWEASSFDPDLSIPRSMASARYNGMLATNLLLEVGASTRETRWVRRGGDHRTTDFDDARDIAQGTFGFDMTMGGGWGAPVWCGVCGDDVRESEAIGFKGTWYRATTRAGTHAITTGYERFAESRQFDFYNSGSLFSVYVYATPPEREPDGTFRPIVSAGDVIVFMPLVTKSQGSDLVTESMFINDKWDFGSRWSFNLGLRFDRNDATDSAGQEVSDDRNVSPRLGVIHDIRGDGRFRVNASYSEYVSKIWEWPGNQHGGGLPTYVGYEYRGPTVGGAGTRLGSFDVLEEVFRWFLAQGGATATDLVIFAGGPDAARVEELKSPRCQEWTLGFGAQLGTAGFVRVDYIDREWGDSYATSNAPGDQVSSPLAPGLMLDVMTWGNSNDLKRTYQAVAVQASFRPSGRLGFGGNYTWSRSRGNEGYFYHSLFSTSSPFTYSEYKAYPQFNPVGYLNSDQTHVGRVWAGFDQHLGRWGALNVSLLETYASGRPYSAAGYIEVRPYATNPGYASPPSYLNYYFSDRGEYRWEATTSSDLAVNYELPVRGARIFAQGEILNLFNEQAQIDGSTAVDVLAPFDPFTETPMECPKAKDDCTGYHWQKSADFGRGLSPDHYQLPRTYRFSVGVRF